MINYIHNISEENYRILRKAVGWKEIEPTQAQTGINNSSYLVAALDNDKTVGMARLVSDGGYVAIICDVIVLPEYQGKGIGKCMVKKIINYIEHNLKEGQTVMVNLMAAKGRESFYSQFGFIKRPDGNYGSGMSQMITQRLSPERQ